MGRRRPLGAKIKGRARGLRAEGTFPERLLWGKLRGGRLAGLKFRRQHPIGSFIVDFYCDAPRVAIELDGDSHSGRALYDERRTAALAKCGVRILRISNDDALRDLDCVLEQIARECANAPGDT